MNRQFTWLQMLSSQQISEKIIRFASHEGKDNNTIIK